MNTIRNLLVLASVVAIASCGGVDIPYDWDCECYADYEDDYYYYSDDWDVTVCAYDFEMDWAVDEAVDQCASDLVSLGYYNVICSCVCDNTWDPC